MTEQYAATAPLAVTIAEGAAVVTLTSGDAVQQWVMTRAQLAASQRTIARALANWPRGD